jgi:hypothetical protein
MGGCEGVLRRKQGKTIGSEKVGHGEWEGRCGVSCLGKATCFPSSRAQLVAVAALICSSHVC